MVQQFMTNEKSNLHNLLQFMQLTNMLSIA